MGCNEWHFLYPLGAAIGPLLAGLISPTGWNNVFYMLIAADVLACLVSGGYMFANQTTSSNGQRGAAMSM